MPIGHILELLLETKTKHRDRNYEKFVAICLLIFTSQIKQMINQKLQKKTKPENPSTVPTATRQLYKDTTAIKDQKEQF